MGRLLVILGIVAIVGGTVGIVVTSMRGVGDLVSAVNPGAIDARAQDLCKTGEELQTEQGPETYDVDTGWGRPIYYYCVNAAGERREVTDQFVSGLFTDTTGGVMSLFSGLVLWIVLICAGPVLIVLGTFIGIRRSRRSGGMEGLVQVPAMGVIGSGDPGDPGGMGRRNTGWAVPAKQAAPPAQSGDGEDLATRLKKLEQARDAGLISQDAFDQLRKQMLDEL